MQIRNLRMGITRPSPPTLAEMPEETAEPEESWAEPTYRAYRALFSHFPDPISCHAALDEATRATADPEEYPEEETWSA